MKKKALGKGLKAFFPEEYGILKEDKLAELEIDQIKPNPDQPREKFDSRSLQELANSIKETGILQPVVVTPQDDHYKLVIGERRWRAAQKAGVAKIPAIIRNMTDEQQTEASLIENIQREDLNPIEIATSYQKLTNQFHYTHEEIAEKVGKDRASVSNYLRLLLLPQKIQEMISDKKLSMGHARALITIRDPELQASLASQIIKKELSVRSAEKLTSRFQQKPEKKPVLMDPDLLALQEDLLKILGTKVTLSGTPDKGVIKIHYFSMDELNRIYERIK